MKIFTIYLLFVVFFIEEVLNLKLIDIRGISLYNLNVYLLLIVWCVTIVKRHVFFENNNLNKYLFILFYIVLCSIPIKILNSEIHKVNLIKEIVIFKNWIEPYLLFFILFNIIEDKKTCYRVLGGLYFLLFALILNQLLSIFGLTEFQAAELAMRGRIGGFSSAGVYAVTLALFTPTLISFIFIFKNNKVLQVCSIFFLPLIFMGFINAGSRNGFLSFLIALLIYLYFLKRDNLISILTTLLVLLLLSVTGILSFVASPDEVTSNVIERFDPDTSEDIRRYSSGRTELWKYGWQFFLERPILGHGQQSFKALTEQRNYRFSGAPHNDYLGYLIHFGIIGLLCVIVILNTIFQFILKYSQKSNDIKKKVFAIGYISGLLGFCVGMFFSNMQPASPLFWIYTATIYKFVHLDEAENSDSVPKALKPPLAINY